MPRWLASTNGIRDTASTTASISTIALPPQSWETSSTNFCPKPVDPRGFGAAITQPCAAHSAGFHRDDHASDHAPCGPPWIRNTVGYLRDASKFGGLSSQYLSLIHI